MSPEGDCVEQRVLVAPRIPLQRALERAGRWREHAPPLLRRSTRLPALPPSHYSATTHRKQLHPSPFKNSCARVASWRAAAVLPARLPPRVIGVEERFGAKRSRCAPIFQRPDLSPARCNYVAPPARSSARPRPTGFARGLHTITTAEFVPAHGGAAHRWRANPTSLPAE
jgi:hypothetical protein